MIGVKARYKMKIKLSFFGILMLAALFFTHSYLSLAALLASALHELAHMTAAKLCKIQIQELRLDIFGAALKVERTMLSYSKEIILAAAGPLANILSALLLLFFLRGASALPPFLSLFIAASFFLGVLNLLPVSDFDGGRITYCIAECLFSPNVAFGIQRTLSFSVAICLWLLSVYLLLRLGATLSLFVFSIFLLSKLFKCELA